MHEKNKLDIVILTDNRYVNPKQKDWYIDQVLQEDKILQKALEKKGLKVCKKDWADTKFDWNTTKFAIFRTTWDYFDRFNEFIKWINKTKKKTTFINPIETIIWNIDKHYLKDLSENGLNITPTLFIEKNEKTNLKKENTDNSLILIGPEGDFSTSEIKLAITKKFKPITLGKSRLRTETAGIIATHTINLNY